MGKKCADMHTHSVYSDGSLTPEEMLGLAKEKGIVEFAITDHDVIEGSKEAVAVAPKDMNVYSGVELTIKAGKGRFHLLGYNFDLEDETLNKTLKEIKENSIYNVLLYIELLKKEFQIFLSKQDIDALVHSKGNIGRPQIALLLVRLGYCSTVDEAFDCYLKKVYEMARTVKRGITVEEGISLIHHAGGVASWAHPNSYLKPSSEFEKELETFIAMGLDGLETVHINETEEERAYYHNLAQKYNLLESGGTDFHGVEVKPDVELGTGRNHNVSIEAGTLSLVKKIPNRYISIK